MSIYGESDSKSHYGKSDIYVQILFGAIPAHTHSLSEVYLHLPLRTHVDVNFSLGHSVVNLLYHVCLVLLHLLRELYHLEKGVLHVVFDVEVRLRPDVLPVLLGLCLRNLRVL